MSEALSKPDSDVSGHGSTVTEGVAICAEVEPLDSAIRSIQPGGGVCMRIELAWGSVRRAWLKTVRKGYLRRMAQLRRGEPTGCPHEVLDPRDLKFLRNQTECHWTAEDDPFTWRDRLPVVRAGLAELLLIGGSLLLVAAVTAWWSPPVAMVPLVGALFVAWFFRNPRRAIPTEPGVVVAPADGRVVEITPIEHDPFLDGPAVQVGIFLSIFNVHVNRTPSRSRVIRLAYRPGRFLNAMRPESSRENERMSVHLEETDWPHRRMIVRQITGAIARRIVCWARPGEELARGSAFGMIKFGSRTELVLPVGVDVEVVVGDRVRAGSSVIARYAPSEATDTGDAGEGA